jgi:hypothetical protein
MRLLGLFLHLSYRLSRHRVMGVRMDLLGLGACLVAALACFQAKPWSWAVLILALVLGLSALVALAQRNGYVLFRSDPETTPKRPPTPPPPDSELPVRATGHFTIRDQVCYLVEHRAILTTPRSREHILMAHLRRSRFLLVGQSHASNWGWWYQFIRPEALIRVELGVIAHGWQPRTALRVSYQTTDSKGNERTAGTILSFDDEQARALAWADLTREMRARPTTG